MTDSAGAGTQRPVPEATATGAPPSTAGAAPEETATAEPTSTTTAGVVLAGVPTACIGLGEQDCRRVREHVATLLDPADAAIRYVQVGPFGCVAGPRCPTTLAARPEGDIALESAEGALSYRISVRNGILHAQPQEVFAVNLPPTSPPPVPGGPRPLTLGHCGLFSGIDIGGSWWDPVGVVDYDHPDAINAAEGTFAPLDPAHAIFTSRGGLTVELVRRDGPKFLPLCD